MKIDLGKRLSVELKPGKGAVFSIRSRTGDVVEAKATERAIGALRRELLETGIFYLPMDCPSCGRLRLEFVGGCIVCDSCGRNHTELPVKPGGQP